MPRRCRNSCTARWQPARMVAVERCNEAVEESQGCPKIELFVAPEVAKCKGKHWWASLASSSRPCCPQPYHGDRCPCISCTCVCCVVINVDQPPGGYPVVQRLQGIPGGHVSAHVRCNVW